MFLYLSYFSAAIVICARVAQRQQQVNQKYNFFANLQVVLLSIVHVNTQDFLKKKILFISKCIVYVFISIIQKLNAKFVQLFIFFNKQNQFFNFANIFGYFILRTEFLSNQCAKSNFALWLFKNFGRVTFCAPKSMRKNYVNRYTKQPC